GYGSAGGLRMVYEAACRGVDGYAAEEVHHDVIAKGPDGAELGQGLCFAGSGSGLVLVQEGHFLCGEADDGRTPIPHAVHIAVRSVPGVVVHLLVFRAVEPVAAAGGEDLLIGTEGLHEEIFHAIAAAEGDVNGPLRLDELGGIRGEDIGCQL